MPQGDVYGQRTHGQQRDDEQYEQEGVLGYGHGIDGHAAHDEEQGNEESVADAIELAFEPLIATGKQEAQHEARGEGTKHDVEVEQGRHHEEADE